MRFKPGDLVWAKMESYPFWPARVMAPTWLAATPPEEGCTRVLFFEEGYYHLDLPPEKIEEYKVGDGEGPRAKMPGCWKKEYIERIRNGCAEAEEYKERWENKAPGGMMEKGFASDTPGKEEVLQLTMKDGDEAGVVGAEVDEDELKEVVTDGDMDEDSAEMAFIERKKEKLALGNAAGSCGDKAAKRMRNKAAGAGSSKVPVKEKKKTGESKRPRTNISSDDDSDGGEDARRKRKDAKVQAVGKSPTRREPSSSLKVEKRGRSRTLSVPTSSAPGGGSSKVKGKKKRKRADDGDDDVIVVDGPLELTDKQIAAMTREHLLDAFQKLRDYTKDQQSVERKLRKKLKHVKRYVDDHGLSDKVRAWKPAALTTVEDVAGTDALRQEAKALQKDAGLAIDGDVEMPVGKSGKSDDVSNKVMDEIVTLAPGISGGDIVSSSAMDADVGEKDEDYDRTSAAVTTAKQEVAVEEKKVVERKRFASKDAFMADREVADEGDPVSDDLPTRSEKPLAKALIGKAEPNAKLSSPGAILHSAPPLRRHPSRLRSTPAGTPTRAVPETRSTPTGTPSRHETGLRSTPTGTPKSGASKSSDSPWKSPGPVASMSTFRIPRKKPASFPKPSGEKSPEISGEGVRSPKQFGGSSPGDALLTAEEQNPRHRQEVPASPTSSPVSHEIVADGFAKELANLLEMLAKYKAKLDGGGVRAQLKEEARAVVAQGVKVKAFPMTLELLQKSECGARVSNFIGSLKNLDCKLAVKLREILIKPWKDVEAKARAEMEDEEASGSGGDDNEKEKSTKSEIKGIRAAVEGMLYTNFGDATSFARGDKESGSPDEKLAESVTRCAKEGEQAMFDRISSGDGSALKALGADMHKALKIALKAAKKVARRRAEAFSPDAASEVKNKEFLDCVEDFIVSEITADQFIKDMLGNLEELNGSK